MSTKNPSFKSGLLDRYLVIAEKNRLKALICINKIDLAQKSEFQIYQQYYNKLGYRTFFTSVKTGEGLDYLKKVLTNSVTALVGHSGVGKSSLIKALEPGLDIKIKEVSARTQKGQHTTTVVQLFPLSFGGYVIDTPGIRELGFWDIYKKDLQKYFIEFRNYMADCQFADCMHIHEPGCAVKAAVEKGEVFKERYENYVNIYLSLKSASYE
jgi:ribosome biogenesis GTPase